MPGTLFLGQLHGKEPRGGGGRSDLGQEGAAAQAFQGACGVEPVRVRARAVVRRLVAERAHPEACECPTPCVVYRAGGQRMGH